MAKQYWLMKSEPNEFSIDDLEARPHQTEPWDGVRNYQARNMMRDQMKKGDRIFFYHSNCDVPGITGIAEVAGKSYPDATAFDPEDHHYDPKSDPENPRWYLVDVKFVRKTKRTIPLAELKDHPELADMPLVRRGNRLSVMPVTPEQWKFILSLE
ncbi:MAG: EVE domain-containing protein [Gammaproteobacteria bacterium]|nr:EVE domain-containing protein [Gammaproteobacteria bacterium]